MSHAPTRLEHDLLGDKSVPADAFVRPGHIFPLRYRAGGVLVRSGHTEAAVDLCKLAGLQAVGAHAELNHDDGTMMRLPALIDFAGRHELPIIARSEPRRGGGQQAGQCDGISRG